MAKFVALMRTADAPPAATINISAVSEVGRLHSRIAASKISSPAAAPPTRDQAIWESREDSRYRFEQ
jgi:hypothetical protein